MLIRLNNLIVLIFKILAIAVAIHGVLFAVVELILLEVISQSEILSQLMWYVLFIPSAILTMPFSKILWSLHLMNVPGWFSGPKPLGFLLVYVSWCLIFMGISLLASYIGKSKKLS